MPRSAASPNPPRSASASDVYFEAVLEPGGPSFMPTQIVMVPLEAFEALGGKVTKRVMGTLNDYPVRLTLMPMQGGERYLMINKDLCRAARVQLGQRVHLRLVPDPDPDFVEVPEELEEGLAAWPEANAGYERLPPGVKRALVQHINSAKRPETRTQRVLNALHQLVAGRNPIRPLHKDM
ncbi:DUF1905 domain-containing protein [Hymenobacter busanensis]|uniref:DUF1905 domain-containing protein n=1 Tax=Hymenobacter busanensis TaxID=2607656 RepID=A0A7L4ZWH9_9BACT|nr:YdeI/OmpD-associated family protein [Hymenobacter busanensis]KAA9333458.1 DUF1905 domain-containing protein [Hymenobacter busanensis]QHJ07859.1 DUF1905 domain-containing protein [Hymenobacter busanensis]